MADRPAHTPDGEIEVTPEMIEAGVDRMYEVDLGGFDPADFRLALASAFRRMFLLMPKRRVNGP